MKFIAKILATFAIILFTNLVEAAELEIDSEKFFVEQKYIVPSSFFRPPIRTPRKEYFPRQPSRPKPHYLPNVPKPTNDNRGGKRKSFGPPRTPRR